MTSKSPHHAKFAKKSKGETEWERLRNECAWPRINDMAKLVIDKNMDKANDSGKFCELFVGFEHFHLI